MDRKKLGATRPLVGAAGAALIASAFLPWIEQGGSATTGWEQYAGAGVLAIVTGATALFAAVTDGSIGYFRPDVSASGAADMFSVVTGLVVGALALFDLPSGAELGVGPVVAITASVVIAGACGDYRVFRGAPLFPR